MDGCPSWLEEALRAVARARVAVFGDFALDAYWTLDPDHRELSLETGLAVRRVLGQRYQPGGAGNVAANLVALGASAVAAVGVSGQDPFGRELRRLLRELGVDTGGLLEGGPDWQTQVFAKPLLDGVEQSRLDFGADSTARNPEALAEQLDHAAGAADAVVLNQQARGGVTTEAVIEALGAVIARHPGTTFVVDARHRADRFRGATVTINAAEAMRWCRGRDPEQPPSDGEVRDLSAELAARTGQPVFVSRGARGVAVATGAGVELVGGIPVRGPIDPVGAGDTMTAALAAALGCGVEPLAAARLANLAAAVTVAKRYTTGTATPAEIAALAREVAGA